LVAHRGNPLAAKKILFARLGGTFPTHGPLFVAWSSDVSLIVAVSLTSRRSPRPPGRAGRDGNAGTLF